MGYMVVFNKHFLFTTFKENPLENQYLKIEKYISYKPDSLKSFSFKHKTVNG